jgi:hypothetical protein
MQVAWIFAIVGRRLIETLRIEYLRHQAAVDQCRRIAERKATHTPQLRQIDFERGKPLFDPVAVPRILGFLRHLELVLEVLEHAQVVERMDLAGDFLSQAAHDGTLERILRQQRRLRMGFVEILDDRHRLNQRPAIDHERRHHAIGIQRAILGLQLHAAFLQQMHALVVIGQALQVQRDTHPERRRAAEVAMEFEHRLTPP